MLNAGHQTSQLTSSGCLSSSGRRGAFREMVLAASTGGVPWIVGSAVDSVNETSARAVSQREKSPSTAKIGGGGRGIP